VNEFQFQMTKRGLGRFKYRDRRFDCWGWAVPHHRDAQPPRLPWRRPGFATAWS